jgi:MFS transporter, DHA3 family, macrolide efflux protein
MKNQRAILLLFVANIISGIAQGITMIAIPWYFAKNGGMQQFSIAYMTSNVISLVWSPYAGTLIDKYNRKNIFLYICLVVGGIESLILLYGWRVGYVSELAILSIFVLTLLNYNIHYNNLYAFCQEIVEDGYFKKITSYLEIASQAATMISGALAAYLLDGSTPNDFLQLNAWTIEEIIFADAITYFVAFAVIYFIQYQPIINNEEDKESLWQRIVLGYEYLMKDTKMFWFGVLSLNIFATFMVFIFTGSTMYVKNILQAGGDTFALVDVYYGLGALLAGVVIQRVFAKVELQKSVIFLTFLTAICYAGMWLYPHQYFYFFLIFLIGITNAGARIQRLVHIFNTVDNRFFGRINSVFSLFNMTLRIIFNAMMALPLFIDANVNNIFPVYIVFLLVTIFLLIKNYKK